MLFEESLSISKWTGAKGDRYISNNDNTTTTNNNNKRSCGGGRKSKITTDGLDGKRRNKIYLHRSIVDDRFLRDESELLVIILVRSQEFALHRVVADGLERPDCMRCNNNNNNTDGGE